MKTIKVSYLHHYILNEGTDKIESKTVNFQTLLSILPNSDKLQKDFVPVVTNLLQPGLENRNATIEFINLMTNSIEVYMIEIGVTLNILYPKNLLELGVVGLATIIMKLFEVLILCININQNKNQ